MFTFHNGKFEEYQKRTGSIPAPILMLTIKIQPYIRELRDEDNLLYETVHMVDGEKVTAWILFIFLLEKLEGERKTLE